MRRTDRLFEIIQLFRGGRLLRGQDIADQVEVSLRTVYRDIETLIASGVPIEGERGVGYLLREPIFLPPLTLSTTELEALHLGMEIVRQMSDSELSDGASRLLNKIDAVLPERRKGLNYLDNLSVFSGDVAAKLSFLAIVRQAIAAKNLLDVAYVTLAGEPSQRVIRPLHVEYWGRVWTCTAWCQLRDDFRVFRIDRLQDCTLTGDHFKTEAGKSYQDYLALSESNET